MMGRRSQAGTEAASPPETAGIWGRKAAHVNSFILTIIQKLRYHLKGIVHSDNSASDYAHIF